MNPLFMPITPGLLQHIRHTSIVVGTFSIVLVVACAITIVGTGFLLPTATGAAMIFVVLAGATSSFLALFSGIMTATGPSYVKTGQLNVTHAGQARRIHLILWLFTFPPTGFSTLLFMGGASTYAAFTPAVFGYLALLFLPFVVALVNMIIGRRLFMPTASVIRKYGIPR